jgi:hypothetical protein
MHPHAEQACVDHRSSVSTNTARLLAHLYLSICLNVLHPASKTDLAILVFAREAAFTFPTTTILFSRVILALATWS